MIDHGDRVGIPSRDRCRRGVAVAMFGGGEPRVESREFASVIVERGGGDAAGPAVDGQPSERAAEGRSGIAPIVAQVTVLPFPAAGRIVRDEFDDGAIAGLVGVGDVKVEQRVVFEGRRVTTVPQHQDDGGAEFRSVRQRIVEGRNPSATGTVFRTSKGPSTNTMCRSVSAKSWTNPSSGIGIVAGPCSRPPRSNHLSPVRIEGPSAGRHREPRARHSRTTCPRSPAIRRRTVAHPLRKGSTLVDIVTERALKHITGPPLAAHLGPTPETAVEFMVGVVFSQLLSPARHMTHADVAAYVTNAIYRPDSRGSAVELRDPSGQQRGERRPRRVRSQRGPRSRIRRGRPAGQICGTGGE